MAAIERFKSRIRLFKWNVKLPEEETEEVSLGGLLLIRVGVLFSWSTPQSPGRGKRMAATYSLSQDQARGFGSFSTRQLLLLLALECFGFLGSCNIYLEQVARELAAEIQCQFCFSPEILSGQGPKLVVLLDLEFYPVPGRSEPSDSSTEANMVIAFDDHSGNHGEHDVAKRDHAAICQFCHHGLDLGVEEIEDVLNSRYGFSINTDEESKGGGLHEVKAGLEFKVFHEDDSEVKSCSICLERLPEGMGVAETPCSHTFHMTCMYKWLRRANSCPLCRSACAICV